MLRGAFLPDPLRPPGRQRGPGWPFRFTRMCPGSQDLGGTVHSGEDWQPLMISDRLKNCGYMPVWSERGVSFAMADADMVREVWFKTKVWRSPPAAASCAKEQDRVKYGRVLQFGIVSCLGNVLS